MHATVSDMAVARIALGLSLVLALSRCASSSNESEQSDKESSRADETEASESSSDRLSADAGMEATSAAEPSSDATSSVDAAMPLAEEPPRRDFPNGDPGCGLEAAAFCDTFDDVAPEGLPEGRSGDLDPRLYVGERGEVTNYGEEAWAVPFAVTRPCRTGLGDTVGAGEDLLVCDGTDAIQSRHAMIVTAEQNYGQSGVRIRQPFDFFEREGHIVFDLDGEPGGGLLGWNAVSITEEPSPNPSFAILQNFENGPIPERGIEIHFGSNCRSEGMISVSQVHVFDAWVDHYIDTEDDGNPPCVAAAEGHLNHFEIRLSRTHLEVLGTDYSADGVSFGALVPIFAADIELAFDRGYVHLVTHNHATLKYSENTIDAWVSRWDNVGFDGPVVDDRREVSIGNSLTPVTLTHNLGNDVFVDEDRLNIGYQMGGSDEGPLQVFTFEGVDTSRVGRAFVSLNAQLLMGWDGFDFHDYGLRYRINGGEWRDHALYPGPFNGPFVYGEDGVNTREEGDGLGGRIAVALDVEVASLMDGENTFEIVTHNVPRSYPPIVANIDLVMFTE
jgi:hypothetical protein